MKVKLSTIAKASVIVLVFIHQCYFLILLGNTSLFSDGFIPKTRMMLILLIELISVIITLPNFKKNNVFFSIELIVGTFVIFIGFLSVYLKGSSFLDCLALVRPYFYLYISIPLVYLIKQNIWTPKNIIQFITISTSIDTILRGIDSIYEYFYGVLLWPNLSSVTNWYRNGFFRINPSPFDILIIPFCFYLISTSKNKSQKIKWIILLIINFSYTAIIWEARSAFLYKIILLVILIFAKRESNKKKAIRLLVFMALIIALINTPVVYDFFESFSMSSMTYGNSTSARLSALNSFWPKYLQSPIFGLGLLSVPERYGALGIGMLEDLGFLYGIFQLGLPMIIFYILIFSRGYSVSKKIKEKDNDLSLMIFGLTNMFIIFGINIDSFYLFSMAIPFYIAIVETSKKQI